MDLLISSLIGAGQFAQRVWAFQTWQAHPTRENEAKWLLHQRVTPQDYAAFAGVFFVGLAIVTMAGVALDSRRKGSRRKDSTEDTA